MTVSCRLAPLRQKPSGVPRASVTRWRFVPGLPRSVGFGPVAGPLFSRDRRAVQASPVPVDLTRCVQALQQHVMQAAPYARRLPIPQPPPATHAGAAAHLGRQHLPRQTRAQHEQDARQCGPILDRTTPALGTGPRRREERSDLIPEIIGEKRSGHAKPTLDIRPGAVLLGALSVPAWSSRPTTRMPVRRHRLKAQPSIRRLGLPRAAALIDVRTDYRRAAGSTPG